jgi:hypothetical protein
MDIADLADEVIRIELEAVLRVRYPAGPSPTGRCLWCGEPLTEQLRWCDAACRDDWERHYARHA